MAWEKQGEKENNTNKWVYYRKPPLKIVWACEKYLMPARPSPPLSRCISTDTGELLQLPDWRVTSKAHPKEKTSAPFSFPYRREKYLPNASLCATLGKTSECCSRVSLTLCWLQSLGQAVCVKVWKRFGAQSAPWVGQSEWCWKGNLSQEPLPGCVCPVWGFFCVCWLPTCPVLLHTSLPACVPEFMGFQGQLCEVHIPCAPKSPLR